jgi:CRISPR/Cas system CMR-associated protein Cmr5 small subunit
MSRKTIAQRRAMAALAQVRKVKNADPATRKAYVSYLAVSFR